MKPRHYFFIFLIGLIVRIGVGLLQNNPGYMDADYYFIGGRNLAEGNGFSEFVIWNYLDNPSKIPHPSDGYWMPFASILAAIGMILTQSQQYFSHIVARTHVYLKIKRKYKTNIK